MSGRYFVGVGVVVDKELGLVVVDKTTVPVSLGDVMLTFNGREVRLRGRSSLGGVKSRGQGCEIPLLLAGTVPVLEILQR